MQNIKSLINSAIPFSAILKKMTFLSTILLLPGYVLSQTNSPLNDGKGAFATGNYRNLLKENGHSKKAIAKKIDSAFRQLFHGDTATQVSTSMQGKTKMGRWLM